MIINSKGGYAEVEFTNQNRSLAKGNTRKRQSFETRSTWWYLLFPLVLFLWPLIRIFCCKKFNFSLCAAILAIIVLFGMFFDVFTLSLYSYFFVNYGSVVLVEFSIFLNRPIEPLPQSIRQAIDDCDEMGVYNRLSSAGKRQIRILIVFTFLIILIADIVVTIYYKVSTDFYENFGMLELTFLHINESALFTFVLLKSIEFASFYIYATDDLKQIDTAIYDFFEKYDSATIYKTNFDIRKSIVHWRSVFQTFALMDFAQTLSFVGLLFLLIARHFVTIDYLTNYLITEDALMNETQVFTDGSNFTIMAYLGFSACALSIKFIFSFQATSIHSQIKSQLNELKTHLTYFSQIPESFIKSKDLKIDQEIEWTDDDFDKIAYEKLFDAERNILGPLITFIKEREGKGKFSYRFLIEVIPRYAVLSLGRLDLVETEYDKFYSVIEYKLFGLFAINQSLMIKIGTAVFTAIVTWACKYAKDHPVDL